MGECRRCKKAFSEDLPLRNLLDWKAREVLIGNEPIKSKFSSFLYVGNPLGCETLEVFLRSAAKTCQGEASSHA
jgi:hypothetical protein